MRWMKNGFWMIVSKNSITAILFDAEEFKTNITKNPSRNHLIPNKSYNVSETKMHATKLDPFRNRILRHLREVQTYLSQGFWNKL